MQLIYTLAVLCGLLTMASCSDGTTDAKISVILKPELLSDSPNNIAPIGLKIPRNYFVHAANAQAASSSEGAQLVSLWMEYPSMQGYTSDNSAVLTNKSSPNRGVRAHLAVALSKDSWGVMQRDAALAAAPTSPRRIVLNAETRRDQIQTYHFPNQPSGAHAYFFGSPTGDVYIRCSWSRGLCTAFKTWRGVLSVRFDFFEQQITDFRDLDQKLDQLLRSFEVQ